MKLNAMKTKDMWICFRKSNPQPPNELSFYYSSFASGIVLLLLCFVLLCCVVLYCVVLCCVVLCCVVLCCVLFVVL